MSPSQLCWCDVTAAYHNSSTVMRFHRKKLVSNFLIFFLLFFVVVVAAVILSILPFYLRCQRFSSNSMKNEIERHKKLNGKFVGVAMITSRNGPLPLFFRFISAFLKFRRCRDMVFYFMSKIDANNKSSFSTQLKWSLFIVDVFNHFCSSHAITTIESFDPSPSWRLSSLKRVAFDVIVCWLI